jgi:hypothetical protein
LEELVPESHLTSIWYGTVTKIVLIYFLESKPDVLCKITESPNIGMNQCWSVITLFP